MSSESLDFAEDGAAVFRAVLTPPQIEALRRLEASGPGRRLEVDALPAAMHPATTIAQRLLGTGARPVRAVLFDKTANDNWALGWHQDRTIAVRAQADVPGFGPWTVKQGIVHVAPPIDVLERMATLRLHIDDCDIGNAPLKIARGSHRLGYVSVGDAVMRAAALSQHVCTAMAGDIWAYATPILHASDRAETPSRRRVLQIDYAAFDLPGGLAWLD